MKCPKEDFCVAEEWYIIFREAYEEREWKQWKKDFCNNSFKDCCFYQSKCFLFNPSRRFYQSEKVREVIRILEGKK